MLSQVKMHRLSAGMHARIRPTCGNGSDRLIARHLSVESSREHLFDFTLDRSFWLALAVLWCCRGLYLEALEGGSVVGNAASESNQILFEILIVDVVAIVFHNNAAAVVIVLFLNHINFVDARQ